MPNKLLPKFEEITATTDQFCHEHLNDEYASLAKKMTAALARKRPSPLESGRAKSWAAGIVHSVGRVNFLSDKSQDPHMKMQDLCKLFGVSEATVSAKSTAIWRMLDLHHFHPDYSLGEILERNPLTWYLMVNGFIMDIRDAPREAQVIAYEKGLIPYIPADRENEANDTADGA